MSVFYPLHSLFVQPPQTRRQEKRNLQVQLMKVAVHTEEEDSEICCVLDSSGRGISVHVKLFECIDLEVESLK